VEQTALFFESLLLKDSVDQFSQNRYILIRNPQGGEKAWGRKETFVKYRKVKKTLRLPSIQDKNGDTNKMVCIQLLLNQKIRAVPKIKSFD